MEQKSAGRRAQSAGLPPSPNLRKASVGEGRLWRTEKEQTEDLKGPEYELNIDQLTFSHYIAEAES
ncbi:MAG: hypothetical protein V2I37_06770 [Marinilabiliaceae bacterium]|jgi:hypothetical protein|nr:hypothetical protein [Marinilabiliaceae bacterium]